MAREEKEYVEEFFFFIRLLYYSVLIRVTHFRQPVIGKECERKRERENKLKFPLTMRKTKRDNPPQLFKRLYYA